MTTQAARIAAPLSGLAVRLAAWGVGPALVAIAHFTLVDAHPIARMCAFIGVLFLWMKFVVLTERATAGKRRPRNLLAWLTLWPGMRGGTGALARDGMGEDTHATLFTRGIACILAGGVFVLAAHVVWNQTGSVWATAPLAAIAFSLVLHYGLFTLVVTGWRLAGFNVGPLFRNPLASRSLPDFWTRRWNLAYVEMCQETVLRVSRPLGKRASSLLVFLFSGLLHEVAISLPVQQGYGLPLLYFALNGAAMQASTTFKEGGFPARLWAAFWVIAPLPLLFHWPFVTQVLLPIVGVQP